jgi:hypothetical protein
MSTIEAMLLRVPGIMSTVRKTFRASPPLVKEPELVILRRPLGVDPPQAMIFLHPVQVFGGDELRPALAVFRLLPGVAELLDELPVDE